MPYPNAHKPFRLSVSLSFDMLKLVLAAENAMSKTRGKQHLTITTSVAARWLNLKQPGSGWIRGGVPATSLVASCSVV